ncbi:MAG: ribosomal protein small subunit ribosomal protein [Candidatus Kaiserbacteria bacterium]|nr:ribosomal protein small subunit ribosomal protein [Candidatus Kaiserbacteria bacterium]
MLRIRLQRIGRINLPSYRIIVVEHTEGPKTGKFTEIVGTYNPRSKERKINDERVKYWISVGAQPSDTVHNMLVSAGTIQGKKINVLPKFVAPEAPAVEAAPEAAAETPAETPTEAPAEEAAVETPAEAAPEETPAQ